MNGNSIHPVLVNKKSGKVASSHSWLLALAAVAHMKGNTSGILGLLPLMQAEKLLHKNEVTFKTVRGHKGGNLRHITRSQAKSFLPYAIIEFERKRRVFKLLTKKDFSAWRGLMRNFKAIIIKLEKDIKPRKKLYKIYWADGTFVGEYWA